MDDSENVEDGTRFTPKKRKLLPGNGGRYCCVCRRNDQVNRDLTFHTFPMKGKTFVSVKDDVTGVVQKKDRHTIWCEFAKVSEARTKYLCICSLHFKRHDYVPGGYGRQCQRLKNITIPSIFHVNSDCQAQPSVSVATHPTTSEQCNEGLNAAETMDNFYSRCLLCTCRSDVTPHLHIFSQAGKQLQLADKIKNSLNIQIEAELPQNVCHSCMEKLRVTHELVMSSQQARIMLLQMKQQSEEVKQENSDCTMTELDSYQPATDSAAIDNEIKENGIPMDNSGTNCSAEDHSDSALHSTMERVETRTESFEEVLISDIKIEIEEHTINPEGEEMDCLSQDTDGAMSINHPSNEDGYKKCEYFDIIHHENLAGNHHETEASAENENSEIPSSSKHSVDHQSDIIPVKCDLCNKYFKSEKHLGICAITRTRRVRPEFSLKKQQLGMKLRSNSSHPRYRTEPLETHISIEHTNNKNTGIKCIHGDKAFRWYSHLESHCDSQHPGKSIFPCEECVAQFTTYSGYMNHNEAQHSSDVFKGAR